MIQIAEAADEMVPPLYAALARARAAISPAVHDAKNKFHNYEYTSSEAVIGACTRALAEQGLALIPCRFHHESVGQGTWTVTTSWLLTHEEGGGVNMERTMIAIEGKGHPADKAIYAANTTMYAYLLRDLCGLQRPSTDDDVAGRDDTAYQPQRKQAARKQRPRAAPQQPGLEEKAMAAVRQAGTAERLAAVRDRILAEVADETSRQRLLGAVHQRHAELQKGAEPPAEVAPVAGGLPVGKHKAHVHA